MTPPPSTGAPPGIERATLTVMPPLCKQGRARAPAGRHPEAPPPAWMTGMSQAAFVVAVSGTSGAGKSTVVDGIASAVALSGRHAVALHFDDYADMSQLPEDLVGWLERGAKPDEWRTDRLANDLMTRVNSAEPDTVIIVEEPFGRARTPMRKLFDLAIHIDLPLRDLVGAPSPPRLRTRVGRAGPAWD